MSARMTKERRAYIKQRNKWLSGKHCGVRGCFSMATEVHHTRGRVGKLLLDETFWLPVCSGCHDWIHKNIELARERGLICAKGDWNKQP